MFYAHWQAKQIQYAVYTLGLTQGKNQEMTGKFDKPLTSGQMLENSVMKYKRKTTCNTREDLYSTLGL